MEKYRKKGYKISHHASPFETKIHLKKEKEKSKLIGHHKQTKN
jgi:hypothetical protein